MRALFAGFDGACKPSAGGRARACCISRLRLQS